MRATQKASETRLDKMASKLLKLREEMMENNKALESKTAEIDALEKKDATNKAEI